MFKRSSTMQFSSHLLVFSTLFVLCVTDTPDIHNSTLPQSNCGGNEQTLTLLDISKDCIHRAKSYYPNCIEDELNCRKKEKSLAYMNVAMSVISEVKKNYPVCSDHECTKHVERLIDCPECPKHVEKSMNCPECPKHVEKSMNCPECPKHVEKPMDCSDILRSGKNESGVYTIWPRSRIFSNKSLAVYCDMETDGGGWTVIQRRGNFSTPEDYFYKNWESYKKGFGNLKEEFWIGNENIFAISNQAIYTIRFDLKDAEGKAGYAEYHTFWIEEENANYTLHINGHKGNISDAMESHNKMKFSTKDRDNDLWKGSCVVDRQGAWWYNACGLANLNGLYQPGIDSVKGSYWWHWKSNYKGLSGVEIKLRS